jgi:cyclase
MTAHLRVLRPAPNIYAFYDGRVEGYRFAEGENWVDEGALSLGIASYAIVDGMHAVSMTRIFRLNTPSSFAKP